MRKVILTGLCLVFSTASIWAVRPPNDRDGVSPLSVQQFGVRVHFTSRTMLPSVVTGSSIAIHGVLTSTPAIEDSHTITTNMQFVTIRATNTANRTSELLVPSILLSSAGRNTFVVYDPPIVAQKGFSVAHSSEGISSAVFYTYLATTTEVEYWIPREDKGEKMFDTSLYGVKAAKQSIPGAAAADGAGTEALDYTVSEVLVTGSSASITNILYWKGTTTTLRGEEGLWYGWSAGTGSVANFMVTQDSATATGDPTNGLSGPTYYLPEIFYNMLTTDRAEKGLRGTSNFSWPWPLRYEDGLTINRGIHYTDGTTVTSDSFRAYTRPRGSLR